MLQTVRVQLLVLTCVWAVGGCGDGTSADIAPRGHFAHKTIAPGQSSTELYVLVVDDGDQAESEALREWAAQRFMEDPLSDGCGKRDPAAWHVVDKRAVIVRPSTGEFVTPIENPGLAWQTYFRDAESGARWLGEVGTEVLKSVAPANSSYEPLAAAYSVWSLLAGGRTAASLSEAAFMNSLTPNFQAAIAIITAREDESARDPSDYLVELQPGGSQHVIGMVVDGPLSGSCRSSVGSGEAFPRIAAWARQGELSTTKPCESSWVFPTVNFSCKRGCLERAPAVRGDGQVDCKVLARTNSSDPCPNYAGYFDPVGADGNRHEVLEAQGRVCEIQQLSGDALRSCRTEESCSQCSPGFCFDDSSESEACASGYSLPRFVLGAGDARDGWLDIVCNEREQ